MKNEITIQNRKIGKNHPPFIVAEMSGNHNQSLDRALEIVEAAAKTGAHALKLQTYTADTITLDVKEGEFYIDDPNKIASFENSDIPLIRKVAKTGKPMIISTGMATLAELDETVRTVREAGCEDLILLKCTSTYPATPDNTNIITIPHMSDLFNLQVGLSDHTMGVGVAVASVAMGATLIEKHFTLSRADGGVDADFSMEPEEMQQLVVETERAWQALGKIHYGATDAEKSSMIFRRSLYIAQDMKAGDILTAQNLRSVRPGLGLAPKYYDQILGKTIKEDTKKGTPVSWEMVS